MASLLVDWAMLHIPSAVCASSADHACFACFVQCGRLI